MYIFGPRALIINTSAIHNIRVGHGFGGFLGMKVFFLVNAQELSYPPHIKFFYHEYLDIWTN